MRCEAAVPGEALEEAETEAQVEGALRGKHRYLSMGLSDTKTYAANKRDMNIRGQQV